MKERLKRLNELGFEWSVKDAALGKLITFRSLDSLLSHCLRHCIQRTNSWKNTKARMAIVTFLRRTYNENPAFGK